MKILYLDCGMGAAGDMLTAALAELLPDPEAFAAELNGLGIPSVTFALIPAEKCGIKGSRMEVLVHGEEEQEAEEHGHHHHHDHEEEHHHHHDHEEEHHHHPEHEEEHHHHHAHSTLPGIEETVNALKLSENVRKNVLAVYRRIAEAESAVHGRPVEEIHFHEVGALDAVADVTAVCLLMEKLAPDEVIASPVHAGSGTVKCAHGILPVPAPATALLLQGVPIYSTEIKGELCTPTGAALLTTFADRFEAMPLMRTEKIGYGMGKKDFPRANCVRAFLGESEEEKTEIMTELSVNVDDMTAEEIAFACERLFEAGAVEVYTVAANMKKNRPGTLIKIICAPEKKEAVIRAAFRHTATLGIRSVETKRYILSRKSESRETKWGPVRVKSSEGYGAKREKIEYEDLARIAKAEGIPLEEARKAAQAALREEN